MKINEKKEEEKEVKNKKEIKEENEKDLVKVIILRSKTDLIKQLKEKAKEHKLSLNSYVNFILGSSIKKEEPLYKEKINEFEKKEIASRSYFTQSEMELLKKYAEINEWSVSKEVRYRTISSLSKKPKLNKEELKAIYSVRSSINVLGANLNRIIRNKEVISDQNIEVCKELSKLIGELKLQINWLMKCSSTSFKFKDK